MMIEATPNSASPNMEILCAPAWSAGNYGLDCTYIYKIVAG